MPFAKRGDVVHSEATSGFNNQKKSLLINGLAALGDSLHPLHSHCPPASSGTRQWRFRYAQEQIFRVLKKDVCLVRRRETAILASAARPLHSFMTKL